MHYINLRAHLIFIVVIGLCPSCRKDIHEEATKTVADSSARFTLLPPQTTGIDFVNTLAEGPNTNILMYEYFYNGGGVATGDLNGDGQIDIYFTANMDRNKVYLNQGKMKFTDVTDASGAAGRKGPWKTGVTLVDINGDHKLDIYLCYSGMVRDENRVNQLFINEGNDDKGIPHFREQAAAYGLASTAYSNQAYFFDYDRDGDLDCLLLNHNPKSLPILNEVSTAAFLKTDDPQKGVRLYQQTKGYFNDVTLHAGINGSALTYGLGIGIADVNNDGWQDFYLSNDYAVPDYLYINNQDGTFTDNLQKSMGHTSQFSMGNDVADINNDGWQDIFTLDMLPEDNHRQKLLLAADNYAKFDLQVRSGFYYQYMRNMLQLNNGNGTFSEVGQLAGISTTDWSWAPLFADYNNDGWKDLFVTNGYTRDYTNLDFIKYMDDFVAIKGRLKREDVLDLVSHMPASNVVNYIFENNKDATFRNVTTAWGLERPSNSNGAAYADLDNDGDLDLVVNNINQPAFIYQNESSKSTNNHYLQLKLDGDGLNTQGIGAKIIITLNGKKQYLEQMPVRGYLSFVSPVLHVGLGSEAIIDTLVIKWLSGKQQVLKNIQSNQILTLAEKEGTIADSPPEKNTHPLFKEIVSRVSVQRVPLKVNDFKRQPLLLSQPSFTGPCMVKGDVNEDGLEDLYIGGGHGTPASLFLQQKENTFIQKVIPAFVADKACEDADAIFVDANHDGHLDLYVASGGYHTLASDDALLQDRLYINDGKGNFTRNLKALPTLLVSKGCVAAGDLNNDGFIDLFVGGRIVPGRYPETPASAIFMNDGKGNFTNETNSLAPALTKAGMITDAVWVDLNQDKKEDLILVGEWMPVSVFINVNGKLQDETTHYFNKPYTGWWNTIMVSDFNRDKKPDLLVGNIGYNTPFRVSDSQPATLYFKDFDNNGSVDPFFCFYVQGKDFPYATRDELVDQISSYRKRFNTYASYADVNLTNLFNDDELKRAGYLHANHMATTLFLSTPDNTFQPAPLPAQVQYAPVHTITVLDYDNDGFSDVLLCGNNSHFKIRLGQQDANYGMLLRGDGNGGFHYISQTTSGFNIRGDVRAVLQFDKQLLFGMNEKKLITYKRIK